MRIPVLYVLFLLFGVDDSILMHMAIGTSLLLSLPSAILSLRKEYRSWNENEEKDRISHFLKGWIPALVFGLICGLAAVGYLPDQLLIAVFILGLLFISVEVFIFRDTYSPIERFSNRITKALAAFVTGAASALSGLSGVLTRGVLRSFAYPDEAVYAAAASGFLICTIGTLGYMISGYGVSVEHTFKLGYVDLLAAAMMMPGSLLAPRLGQRVGRLPGFQKFTEAIISDRLTDPFTGLYKRRHFDSVLSYFVAHADRFSAPVSVMMIDVDNLTVITRFHGQKTANSILLEVTRLLTESLRRIDIASRYGGDEFTVILPGADKEASIIAADRIIKKLRTISVELSGEAVPVSFSIGISTHFPKAAGSDSLVLRSERAMYASKSSGRDMVTHYEDITLI